MGVYNGPVPLKSDEFNLSHGLESWGFNMFCYSLMILKIDKGGWNLKLSYFYYLGRERE